MQVDLVHLQCDLDGSVCYLVVVVVVQARNTSDVEPGSVVVFIVTAVVAVSGIRKEEGPDS